MPARLFDRDRVRKVRRDAETSQSDVASAVGVADSTVAGWELGTNAPDQEKLPALARVLKKPLDVLFPRNGLPDLTDLRCDAGLYRYEVAGVIGTKSAGPVAGAENGVRPLKERYLPDLATAYGVTVKELEQAQERSMAKARGEELEGDAAAASVEEPPRTLAEKITLLLERSYPSGAAPGDGEIADAVNAYAGSQVTTAEKVEALRTGADEAEAPAPVVLDGIARFLGVTRLYFEPGDEVARQVVEGLRLMRAGKSGKVGRIRARGMGSEGLSADVLSMLNEFATELEKKDAPDADE
ncbi:helix-turn-helix transcriptional regulator [Streptomyces sp. H39-S7]|uniref:helix-turn-helix transcriptional regulator n=1 Tax=Streptomyces sp. H39-S7 TaxID=3004357 RepID=UPI0022AE785C|nr:helix-turn-helix transcriptional regulator [Streptomyces sp. H39-S7]MCZ4118086.1 helix-turn-helix transcriptional regulator [Streptomyces sp. H39-S7]